VKLGRKGNPFWQAPPRSLSQAREVSASPRAPLSQVRQERGAFAAQKLEAHKPHISGAAPPLHCNSSHKKPRRHFSNRSRIECKLEPNRKNP
jgi:hypothetical protein